MDKEYICPRCGNKNSRYIGVIKGQKYCRLCISFQGKSAPSYTPLPHRNHFLKLDYKLSIEQEKIAQRIKKNFENNINTLVHAVTGAGKTELVYYSMLMALHQGKRVGFAIPRKDVVVEIAGRLKSAFPSSVITAVYGGQNSDLGGDIIVLTTHQLYRYDHFFDLLIFDEIDAFPYRDSIVLSSFLRKAVRGTIIYLSATVNPTDKANFQKQGGEVIELFHRYHGRPLPIPSIVQSWGVINYWHLFWTVRTLLKMAAPVFIFVPTIAMAKKTFRFLNIFFKKGNYVHSQRKKRAEIIDRFRNHQYRYLCCTSVLERGVTVAKLKVIVFNADHYLFDRATLVQIAGRSGRKRSDPIGRVIFISETVTTAMKDAINDIKEKNIDL